MAARLPSASRLAFGLSLGLAACATAKPPVYGPISATEPYGYRDRANGDGAHTVLAVVPPHSSAAEARAFWERRAGELCPAGVSKRIVFRSERKEIMSHAGYVYGATGFSSRSTQAFEVEGYVYCNATRR